ncbi:MAG: OadG family protein [Bacteroidales bacterium]|nr:OadG family protein [Bacteroides sp.]MCM1198252.1 OadG family protein [Clostridium sp.]MCM1502372.1 OadG family protein [Bacteroidales bacterium]
MKLLNRLSIAAVLLTICQVAGADVQTKSAQMLDKDPHGWIMTVTSVCVVFAVLILLWFIYSLVGKAFTGKRSMESRAAAPAKAGMTGEVAAAIAMALEKENNSEVNAAIALALHQYMNDTVHDQESFVLTIKPTFGPYAARQFTLRQLPEKKK